jgi:hypothetical protein
MQSTEQHLVDTMHDWLHTYPIQEMPAPFNHIARRFRNKSLNLESARNALFKHLAYLDACKKNNHFLAMALEDIPDSED